MTIKERHDSLVEELKATKNKLVKLERDGNRDMREFLTVNRMELSCIHIMKLIIGLFV